MIASLKRHLKLVAGLVLLTMTAACMVAGRDADIADWPGMASLQTVSGNRVYHECGATMIAPDWALTAAHCVEMARIETTGRAAQYTRERNGRLTRLGTMAVAAGLGDLTVIPPHSVFPVAEVLIHPDYEPGALERGHDIALLRLAGPAPGDAPRRADRVSRRARGAICRGVGRRLWQEG